MNVRNLLRGVSGGRAAIIEDDRKITYAQLSQITQRVCESVKKNFRDTVNKHVMIFLPSGANFAAAFFGVIQAGKTAFPVSTENTVFETSRLLENSDTECVITDTKHENYFAQVNGFLQKPVRILLADEITGLEKRNISKEKEKIRFNESADTDDEIANPDEAMVLLGTSGTTGNSKIVMLSENNIGFTSEAYLKKMNFSQFKNNRYILGTPFFTAYGIMILTACFSKKFTLIMPCGRDALSGVLEAAQKHKAAMYEGGSAILAMLDKMTGNGVSFQFEYPKYLGCGGSKISADTLLSLKRKFPEKEFWSGYGMTEASPLITKQYKRFPVDKFASVGTPLTGINVKIEIDGKKTSKPFRTGEILVKGRNVMLGYYNNAEATENCIVDGYLHTGDIGYFDEKRYLYICGRKKNIIIVRGFNVFPDEVQAVLSESKLVSDCVVYGESDADGEIVCADVIPARQGVKKEDIAEFCRTRLAEFKIPRKINFVEEIFKTPTCKNISSASYSQGKAEKRRKAK